MGAIDGLLAVIEPEELANPAEWLRVTDHFVDTLNTGRWETVKDAGAAAATADGAGGVLTLSSAATTENDGALVQSINEIVLPTSGKRFALEAKAKVSAADAIDFFFGLATVVATNPENILTTGNRIGFEVLDGNASIICKTEATDVETAKDSELDFVNDTYRTLGIAYDGAGMVSFYINGTLIHTITTNIPATELGVVLFHLSGTASGTVTSAWDYVDLLVEL